MVDHVHIGKVSVRNHEPQRHSRFFFFGFLFSQTTRVGGGNSFKKAREPDHGVRWRTSYSTDVFFFSFWDSSHEAESEGFDDTCILGYMITTCT